MKNAIHYNQNLAPHLYGKHSATINKWYIKQSLSIKRRQRRAFKKFLQRAALILFSHTVCVHCTTINTGGDLLKCPWTVVCVMLKNIMY